jgi:hypothetical protein
MAQVFAGMCEIFYGASKKFARLGTYKNNIFMLFSVWHSTERLKNGASHIHQLNINYFANDHNLTICCYLGVSRHLQRNT